MFKRGDFHVHSCKSDGELKPGEIVLLAKERGLDIIALTDHNCVSGNDEAIKVGDIFNVKVIPGIELSTRFKGFRVHVLGYFTNKKYNNYEFREALRLIKKGKIKACSAKYNENLYLKSEGAKISTKSGIDFLHYYDAKVVLAHPVFLPKDIFLRIINLDFDGIEAKYYRNTDNDTEYFINIANEKGIFYTAGSDFHTLSKIDIKHGTLGQIYLIQEEMKKIDFLQ